MIAVRHCVGLALLSSVSVASAGWFDWFKPAEWAGGVAGLFDSDGEGGRGLYLGGSAGVMRADYGLQRRLGGVADRGIIPDDVLYMDEPAYMTIATLRGGWQPFRWLEAEVEWGFDVDKAEVSENPRQVAELDSLTSVMLRPQLPLGGANLFLELGFNDIRINTQCGTSDTNADADIRRDPTLEASCQSFEESSFAYGAGVSFKLSQQASLQFAWRQMYDDDFNNNGDNDSVTGLSIGVTMAFGGGSSDDYYD
nr:outer membrane beta-barrel protein [Oceanococcus sp. HetDA_MAG_MS8]